jgi:hypothetical protein
MFEVYVQGKSLHRAKSNDTETGVEAKDTSRPEDLQHTR